MKEHIIDISHYQNLDKLEQKHYEYQSYRNIIQYMLSTGQYDTAGFKYYQSEFSKHLKEYENEKMKFQKDIVEPIMSIKNLSFISWEINFFTKEVTINE